MNNSCSAIAVIQARMSSTRLPGKMLMPLGYKPMLWHVVERAKRCRRVNKVVVATSNDLSDDAIAHYCTENDISCLRGSLTDVLGRFIDVSDKFPSDYIVRITGDCPLISPEFIDFQLDVASSQKADIVQLDRRSGVLEGQGVHSTNSLREVFENSKDPDDREHVGSRYLIKFKNLFKVVGIKLPAVYYDTSFRLAVDELPDYRVMNKIYENLWQPGEIVPLLDALDFLKKMPHIAEANQSVEHNEITESLNINKHRDAQKVESWHVWNG